jgi:AmmeMemoRadiSam system protein A
MDAQGKEILLRIARSVVEAAVRGQPRPKFEETHADLQAHAGAFVTLKTAGRLRGCIGVFTADKPVYQVVAEMAEQSARHDPRFLYDRITPGELPRLHIEVSVLSPLKKVQDPLDFELGTHGIYVKRGISTGCFLPQVADETGWDKEQFLSYCCSHKAGLAPFFNDTATTEIYTFTAEIISE